MVTLCGGFVDHLLRFPGRHDNCLQARLRDLAGFAAKALAVENLLWGSTRWGQSRCVNIGQGRQPLHDLRDPLQQPCKPSISKTSPGKQHANP
jgi:hypothetical protein